METLLVGQVFCEHFNCIQTGKNIDIKLTCMFTRAKECCCRMQPILHCFTLGINFTALRIIVQFRYCRNTQQTIGSNHSVVAMSRLIIYAKHLSIVYNFISLYLFKAPCQGGKEDYWSHQNIFYFVSTAIQKLVDDCSPELFILKETHCKAWDVLMTCMQQFPSAP